MDLDIHKQEEDNYEKINFAINRIIYSGKYHDLPNYINLDELLDGELLDNLGFTLDQFEKKLGKIVNDKLLWGKLNIYEKFERDSQSWKKTNSNTPPPFTALLAVLTIAASRMREGKKFSGSNFYVRLFELLGHDQSDKKRFDRLKQAGKYTEIFWTELNFWLESNDGEYGYPTAESYIKKYIGYPISQALIRRTDRQKLHNFFRKYSLTPSDSVYPDEIKIRYEEWLDSGQATKWLEIVWKNIELRSQLIKICIDELKLWSSSKENQEKSYIEKISLLIKFRPKGFFSDESKVEFFFRVLDQEVKTFNNFSEIDTLKKPFLINETYACIKDSSSEHSIIDIKDTTLKSALPFCSFNLYNNEKCFNYRGGIAIPLLKTHDGYEQVLRVTIGRRYNILVYSPFVKKVETHLKKCTVKYEKLSGVEMHQDWLIFKDVEFEKRINDVDSTLINLNPLSLDDEIIFLQGFEIGKVGFHYKTFHIDLPPTLKLKEEKYSDLEVLKDEEDATLEFKAAYEDGSNLKNFSNNSSQIDFKLNDRIKFRLTNANRPKAINRSREEQFLISSQLYKLESEEFIYGYIFEGKNDDIDIDQDLNTVINIDHFEESNYLDAVQEFIPIDHYLTLCAGRGYHVWLVPEGATHTSKHQDVCADCGDSRISLPNRDQDVALEREISYLDVVGVKSKPNIRSLSDTVFDAICYKGQGSFNQLSKLIEPLGNASSNFYSNDLSDLGNLELFISKETNSTYWFVPPPTLVYTSEEVVFLSGFRCANVISKITTVLGGNEPFRIEQDLNYSPTSLFWSVSFDQLQNVEKELKKIQDPHGRSLSVTFSAAMTLLNKSYSVRENFKKMEEVDIDNVSYLEKFNLSTLRWTESNISGGGAYRGGVFAKEYFYYSEKDKKAFSTTYEISKILAARLEGRRLHRFRSIPQIFDSQLGCKPPNYIRRALVSCSGVLPEFKNQMLQYHNIDTNVAQRVMDLMYG